MRDLRRIVSAAATLLLCIDGGVIAADEIGEVDSAALEADGVVIGRIILEKSDVFDLSDPREDKWLYRLANKWHIVTKDEVITNQLLVKPGDVYSQQLVDESARILRSNRYLYDAQITPANVRDGSVDLRVATRDVWSLTPIFTIARRGGENKTTLGVEEANLLGRGQRVLLEYADDVDRISRSFEFRDTHVGSSWVSASLSLADNSDGHSRILSVTRPFYALDTRWSAGTTAFDDDRRTAFYDLGDEAAEFRHQREQFTAFGGWSQGLRGNWVSRYTAGIVYDDNVFGPVVDGLLPAVIPDDRKLVYPFIGVELLENKYETVSNREQIARTEDFFTGTRLTATLGWADEGFGADRDAILFWANYSRGFGSLESTALLLRASTSGRNERGDLKNALVHLDARYFRKQSDRRVFYATISGTLGRDLDLDNVVQLGGLTGLRGYPLRYQNGESKLLATVEQRYYWNWYPFRLFRVGGAIFADVGRTWGESPIGAGSDGWLRDVGVGLRFAPTRISARKIVHLDLAFPLDGDSSIDEVQVVLEAKRTF